mmetsp:Transcript_7981/g.10167  ORF Transcript_7981/g.10167 Transcript_7981/m.10167 type:complete len:503 (+) Transcript_7981:149-1657(+)
MDSSDTAKPKRDGDEDSINEPPSEDEVEETVNTSSGFPRHDGVDNSASVQTSEAAVMKKMKTFDTARSNALNGVSNTKLEKLEADLRNKRKEIESSNNASKIRDDEDMLWQRKLNLAYGSENQEEETPTKKPKPAVAYGSRKPKEKNSDFSEINDDSDALWQRKLALAYEEVEPPTKKHATKSTSVAWRQKIKRKVRNAPLPVIDPDAPRVEEPPLPWERGQRSQIESLEDNVSEVQPTTDVNVEDPPAQLNDDTPNTGTQVGTEQPSSSQNALPIPHTEAWIVQDRQNQAILVQGEPIEERKTYSAFQLLRKHFRFMLFCSILMSVVLIAIIIPTSKKQQSLQKSTISSSVPSAQPSSNPSSERDVVALNILSDVSDVSLLMDRTTPQGKAFEWILHNDPLRLSPADENFIQRFVLAVLYFSTGGGSWDDCNAPVNVNDLNNCQPSPFSSSRGRAWLTNSPECTWGGITCDHGVTRIDLRGNGLSGTIPSELQYLTDLGEY